ncbi:Oidioi.mRNA.OKI2018_I69.PAR.g9802.t1.cds [Oikopleura dioica]|uniref:Oidioi.mRNA.OKI2018_I69.PAR.g9802.t1.cds n=1 Tax=Oikopleura dioica TaxID=34765 RepID=A0ABN7RMB7_OIKDI|nr:Oidioi.mRNA.OKI2018_I69.PAR.g9802.t1.cds [Oikopleura dioica]
MSIVNWGIYLGYGMSYGLKTLLLQVKWLGVEDSWRWAFWLSTALGVVLIPSVFFLIKDPSDKSKSSNYCQESAETSKYFFSKCIQPSILFLIIGGTLRNSAGYAWGYNQVLFLSEKESSEDYNIDLWLMTCTILCGIPGGMLGGYINDKIKASSTGFIRLKRSLRFVAGALLLSSPLLTAGFYMELPILFAPLFIGYFITEMWYGPYLVAVAELFPENSRGQAIGYTVFLLRLIGGNLPSLLIGPLKSSIDYFWALFILIPGMNILAAIIFLAISCIPFTDNERFEKNTDFHEF